MGLRFRKSINLGGGVRLNFNKKSTGISFGTKGARYSINSNGRKTASIGIPGTGLYWTESKTNKGKGNTNSKKNWILWIILWPLLMIFYIFYFMVKGIVVLIKKIVEILKSDDEQKKKYVYIGLGIFGALLIISMFISLVSSIFSNTPSNNNPNNPPGIVETPTENTEEKKEDPKNNVSENETEDKYIYTSQYGEFIAEGINNVIDGDDIIRYDKVSSYQISSSSVSISLYTNEFYNYSTIQNKAREITKKLLEFYSTKEYKKEYLLSPASISIIIDIRGNSKDIYTGEIENTFMVLSQINFTTDDLKNVSDNVDDYIKMSNKIYFGE